MTDFSTPRRMGGGAFVVLFVKSLKELFGAVFIGIGYLVFKSDHDSSVSILFRVMIALASLIVLSLAVAFVRSIVR